MFMQTCKMRKVCCWWNLKWYWQQKTMLLGPSIIFYLAKNVEFYTNEQKTRFYSSMLVCCVKTARDWDKRNFVLIRKFKLARTIFSTPANLHNYTKWTLIDTEGNNIRTKVSLQKTFLYTSWKKAKRRKEAKNFFSSWLPRPTWLLHFTQTIENSGTLKAISKSLLLDICVSSINTVFFQRALTVFRGKEKKRYFC